VEVSIRSRWSPKLTARKYGLSELRACARKLSMACLISFLFFSRINLSTSQTVGLGISRPRGLIFGDCYKGKLRGIGLNIILHPPLLRI
jgi:hypothetical protein